MTGKMPEEGINKAEFPDVLFDVWQWFLSLNNSRQSGMGESPITESDIGWFFKNRNIKPQGWQINAIRLLDNAALGRLKKNDD